MLTVRCRPSLSRAACLLPHPTPSPVQGPSAASDAVGPARPARPEHTSLTAAHTIVPHAEYIRFDRTVCFRPFLEMIN